jgi:acyl dehydratase
MTYDIDQVRTEWVGRVLDHSRGRYPVEHEPLRRQCHMVGDTNPLFLDPDVARDGPYGAVIAPPTFLIWQMASPGPWPRPPRPSGPRRPAFSFGIPTPGDRGINLSTAWEYLAPVRVGDHLEADRVVKDVYVKPIRLDPLAVWIVTEIRITNQDGECVAVGTNTLLVHRSPRQVAEDEALAG